MQGCTLAVAHATVVIDDTRACANVSLMEDHPDHKSFILKHIKNWARAFGARIQNTGMHLARQNLAPTGALLFEKCARDFLSAPTVYIQK